MAQKTDAQLTTEANIIRDETAIGANTALRIGIMLDNLIDSKTNNNIISDAPLGTSTLIVPTQNAVKTYADGLVTGLLDDRGNFDASTGGSPYPTLNGSGAGSIIQKGDLYFISVAGTVGTTPVAVGASVRALVDTPAQTPTNWDILDAGVGYIPEDTANKSDATNLGGVSPSHTLFPTQYAVKSYVDGTITPTPNLQAVLAAGHNLANGRNFQGTGAGGSNLGFNVNAFGTNSAVNNSGSNINSFGTDSSSGNTGTEINALGTGAAYDNAGNYVNALGHIAAKNNTGSSVNAFGYNAGYNNTFNSVNIFGTFASATTDSQLAMTNDYGHHARISYLGVTADRLYELPDASGTIPLTVNGVGANAAGNIVVSSGGSVNTVKVSLTSADILVLNATPFTLIAAQGAGTLINVLKVWYKYNFITIAYTGGGSIAVNLGTIPVPITSALSNLLNSGSTLLGRPAMSASVFTLPSGFENTPILLNASAAQTLGDGTLDVYLTYDVITL